jgi:putative membrane-bound dehydrogenase-like protein
VREEGEGRVFYTAWGHGPDPWSKPGFKKLIENAIRWTSGNEDSISAGDTRTTSKLQFEELEGDGFVPFGGSDIPSEVSSGTEWSRIQHAQSATDSIARTITPPGFELDPFLTEEMLPEGVGGNILDVEFDAQGRAWVALTRDYPNEIGEGRDSIVICEDTDGDGQADEFTVFADGLSGPMNMVLTSEGAIVVNLGAFDNDGSVIHLKDTNADDQADEREELFSGFNTNDTHAGPNQLEWGIDNWIWGQVGYTGFSGTVGGENHNFNSAVFRFTPDGSELEIVASLPGNQAGLGFSEEGLAFASVATDQQPSNYVAIPQRYYESVEGMAAPTLGPISETNRILPITDRLRQGDNIGGYTAASGHEIYTAREYPERYWNRTAFVSEPTGHLVGTWILQQDGAGYTAQHPRNIVSSADSWMSPIYQTVGPDGMLWFIDWYNYVILHNTGMNLQHGPGNAYENPLRDALRSRLYRLTYGEADAIDPQPIDLSGAGADELIETLTHDNMHWRMVAQRHLVADTDPDTIPDLVELIENESVDDIGIDPGAIHALWTLDGYGVFDLGTQEAALEAARGALEHSSSAVRLTALRVLPGTDETREAILGSDVLNDDDHRVRMWALLALADVPESDPAGEAVYETLNEGASVVDELIGDAATAAAAQHAEGFVAAYEANNDTGGGGEEAPNLLANPSFEASETFQDWATNTWNGDGEYAISTATAHSGERSVRISSENGLDGSVWQQDVSVEPNTTYVYSAWIKTEDLEPGDSYGAVINPQAIGQPGASDPVPSGTSDWTRVETRFDSGTNETLTFNLTLGGWGQASGTVWFDDVRLAEAGSSGAERAENVYQRVLTHLDSTGGGSDPGDTGAIDPDTTIQLNALTAGWEGVAPAGIEGETNPTLTLLAGEEYTVELTNGDTAGHNFILQDADGSEIEGTDVVSGEGETWSLTFTASEEMAQYICTIHAASMVGDVELMDA